MKWESGQVSEDLEAIVDAGDDIHDALFADHVILKTDEERGAANIVVTLVNKVGSGIGVISPPTSFGEGAFPLNDGRYNEILSVLEGGSESKVKGIFKARSGPNYNKYIQKKLSEGLTDQFNPSVIRQMDYYDKLYYFLGSQRFNEIFEGALQYFEPGMITGREELIDRERIAEDLGYSSLEELHRAEHEYYGQYIGNYTKGKKGMGEIAEKDVKRFTAGYVKYLAEKGVKTFERSQGLDPMDSMYGEGGYSETLADFKEIMYKRADDVRENYELHPDARLQAEMDIADRMQYINDGGEMTESEKDMVVERQKGRGSDVRSSRIKQAVINYIDEARTRIKWNKDRNTRAETNKERINELKVELETYSDIDLKQMQADAIEHGWISPKQKLLEEKKLSKYAIAKAWTNIKRYIGELWDF